MMEDDIIFIKNVQQIIQENLNNPNLKGEFIAQLLGISRMHLHRKLKDLLNQNSRELITNLRINYAKQTLQTTDKFIYQVAAECGFKDYTHFSKVFKKVTNYSPLDFRKLCE